MTPELRTFARALHAATSAAPRLPRALVLDTSALVRRRACAELARLGCATRPVPTPLDALQVLDSGEPIDGVVIGPTLTQTRSHEVAAFLAEAYPHLPVLVLAAGPPGWPCARERPSAFLAGLGADGVGALALAA